MFGEPRDPNDSVNSDVRGEYLKEDINQMSLTLNPVKDSITVTLKECIDYDNESGINTDKIKYFTKIENKKNHRK